jgi:hypothetical protein
MRAGRRTQGNKKVGPPVYFTEVAHSQRPLPASKKGRARKKEEMGSKTKTKMDDHLTYEVARFQVRSEKELQR